MMDRFFQHDPYSLKRDDKRKLLSDRVRELTQFHYSHCNKYKDILDAAGIDVQGEMDYDEAPFIPVSLFKKIVLKSVPDEEVFKVMTSSGTTGQAVSRIYLDKETSSMQQKVFARILSSFTGASRMPMIIIDCPSVIKNREMFSARGAGILGFSMFGTKKVYALNEDMTLNLEAVQEFVNQHSGGSVFLFGFTFMIWQHFYQELKKLPAMTLDLSNGILIHGGGWKKLASENISSTRFKEALHVSCGLKNIHDFYGMVEQTGSISMECEYGHLHTSIFSDVITRRTDDFSQCSIGEQGIVQVVSSIPQSYPGHSLLTEDEGIILGEDDCPCGRNGKYFTILGRLKNAEIRGCSDTYAVRF